MEGEADRAFSQALALHRQNIVDQAEQIYRRILKVQPRHFDSLHMLGVVCRQQGQLPEALGYLDEALKINPRNAYVHSNRGNVLRDLSLIDEAINSLSRAIELKPDFFDAFSNRASIYEALSRFNEAIADLEQVLTQNSNHFGAQQGIGNALYHAKRYEQALEAYQLALKLMPDNAGTLSNMGATLLELKRFDAAEQALNRAIKLNPLSAQALNNRANLFIATHRPLRALVDIENAIRIQPVFSDAWLNRGNVLQDLKRFPEAVVSYDRSITLRPNHAPCLNNKGNALREMMQYGEAIALYDQAITLLPDYAEAHYHRAIVLQDLQRYEEAERAFAQAVRLKEDHPRLYGEWVASRMMICAWDGLDALVDRLVMKIREGKNASTTFPLLSCGIPGELTLQCASTYVREQGSDRSWQFEFPPARADRRIRIGYFSSDFRSHAVAQLAAGVFEHHDKERFEVMGFNVASFPTDAMTQRIDRAMGGLIQLGGLSVEDAVAKVRSLNLDIAVDLNGHTKGGNPHIFANRVAPIQVNYLGYPGTSGAPYFDYILADATVIPPEHFGNYCEKVAHLANCYLPSDVEVAIPENSVQRSAAGLPEEGFVFCCFNNSYKITPEVFSLWMRLLGAVQGSVLWLSAFNHCAVGHLQAEACRAGINPARLVFAPRLRDHGDHLARHRLADLFLDTSPYNAHTTAHDALRAGLPVLTCLGNLFPGRVAASLLRSIGMAALVTESLADYEALALKLASEPSELAKYRWQLERNRTGHPLFNTDLFTRDIESVFSRMWERHCQGLAPMHLGSAAPHHAFTQGDC